jgi:hypothetical protein
MKAAITTVDHRFEVVDLPDPSDAGRPVPIALSTLVRRLPGLALAVPADELRFQNEQEIYGIEELPVTW